MLRLGAGRERQPRLSKKYYGAAKQKTSFCLAGSVQQTSVRSAATAARSQGQRSRVYFAAACGSVVLKEEALREALQMVQLQQQQLDMAWMRSQLPYIAFPLMMFSFCSRKSVVARGSLRYGRMQWASERQDALQAARQPCSQQLTSANLDEEAQDQIAQSTMENDALHKESFTLHGVDARESRKFRAKRRSWLA